MERNGCIAFSEGSEKRSWRASALLNTGSSASQTWPLSLALPAPAVLPCATLICYLPKQMPALASQRHSPVPHFTHELPADVLSALALCFTLVSLKRHSGEIPETSLTSLLKRSRKLIKGLRSVLDQTWHKDIQHEWTRCQCLAYLHSELSRTLVESAW